MKLMMACGKFIFVLFFYFFFPSKYMIIAPQFHSLFLKNKNIIQKKIPYINLITMHKQQFCNNLNVNVCFFCRVKPEAIFFQKIIKFCSVYSQQSKSLKLNYLFLLSRLFNSKSYFSIFITHFY